MCKIKRQIKKIVKKIKGGKAKQMKVEIGLELNNCKDCPYKLERKGGAEQRRNIPPFCKNGGCINGRNTFF